VKFAKQFPLERYRRLSFLMLDQAIAAFSPPTIYRVLEAAGLTQTWNVKPSKNGTGLLQQLGPHQRWHVDVSYVNLAGTFYSIGSLLNGCYRTLMHYGQRRSMIESEVEPSPAGRHAR